MFGRHPHDLMAICHMLERGDTLEAIGLNRRASALLDQSSDRIAVKRITSDVNRVCIPWENVTGSIDCPHNDKTHLHVIGFSFAIQVEVISHPDLLRKFTGRHIDAKVVSVIERIDNAIVINSGAQSSRVYVQMGNATAVHPRGGPLKELGNT